MGVLIQVLMWMRALQDRCVANEGVIRRFYNRQEIKNKARDQYMDVVRILNKDLTNTQAKLKEESHLREEAKKAKTNLTTKLAALHEQMDRAKADAMMEFWVSQPYFDACDAYYGDRFDDCLKKVGAVYPDLNLSQIAIDDTEPPMPRGDDTVRDETCWVLSL